MGKILDGGINRDELKLIAAAAMLVDHIGAYLFPHIIFLRIIGRLAFPIFAFMVAEGCHYTRSKVRYMFNLLFFGAAAQMIKVYFGHGGKLNIMFTFVLSAVMIFAPHNVVEKQKQNTTPNVKVYSVLLFAFAVAAVWFANVLFSIDYGFWGCVTPLAVFAGGYVKNTCYTQNQIKTLFLALALALVYMHSGGVQVYAFAALIPLWLYNGQKGGTVPKYFFYIFYPSHLAVLYAIESLM